MRQRLSVLAALLTVAAAAAQPVTLIDTTFNLSDWELIVSPNPQLPVFAGQPQVGTRSVSYGPLPPTGPPAAGTSIRLGFAYTPALQGPISAWDFSALSRNIGAGISFFRFALRQNGSIYVSNQSSSTPDFVAVTALPPLAANYRLDSGPGPAAPDFVTGGPIEFGFQSSFAFPPFIGSYTNEVQDFRLTINPVPEPSALALSVVACAGVAVRRLRRAVTPLGDRVRLAGPGRRRRCRREFVVGVDSALH